MIEPSVEAVDEVLRRHQIRYVVIGGQAVARHAATATQDVDVMVTTAEYHDAVRQLAEDDGLTKAWDGGAVTRFGLQALPGVPLDVVDAGAFAGRRSGSEFFDYLVNEGSAELGGVRYASAEVVWYTRLLTKRWRSYAEKIVTNVIDGLDPGLLVRVEEIGRKFGTEETLGPRIAYVREALGRPELRGLGPGP
jgi:predicted nucleotidyltransferase